MTPKQSKDVDSSHKDRGEGYTHFEGDDCNSSLREQISKLATGYRKYVQNEAGVYSYATEKKLSKKQFIDSVEALVTTYIEAAEIEARIEEWESITNYITESFGFDWYPADFIAYKDNCVKNLQAQKAVLEEKDV